mmetsp:Transcript_4233/g.9449  ORF Transcript_4233/g.9449 Transcript_4233/m.9449 type:complete len:275 (+) Transcript_4233:1-825(+)
MGTSIGGSPPSSPQLHHSRGEDVRAGQSAGGTAAWPPNAGMLTLGFASQSTSIALAALLAALSSCPSSSMRFRKLAMTRSASANLPEGRGCINFFSSRSPRCLMNAIGDEFVSVNNLSISSAIVRTSFASKSSFWFAASPNFRTSIFTVAKGVDTRYIRSSTQLSTVFICQHLSIWPYSIGFLFLNATQFGSSSATPFSNALRACVSLSFLPLSDPSNSDNFFLSGAIALWWLELQSSSSLMYVSNNRMPSRCCGVSCGSTLTEKTTCAPCSTR